MKKPSIISRIKSTIDYYRYGSQYLRPAQSKKAGGLPYSWPVWKSDVPQWHISDYQSLINAGFNRNSILYSAAMYKYYAFKSVPLRAYTGTFEEPELLPPDHWLQKLCMRPNRFQSGPTFQGMADIFANIAGTSYIYIKRVAGRPDSMYLLRPDRVHVTPLSRGPDPIGYYYVPEGNSWSQGIPYQAKDIMCVRMPNPGDDLDGLGEGLAPGSVAAKSINVDNMITDFLQLFFQNGAMPPGYFSYDVPMTPEEIKEARTKLMEIYGGYDEWSKVAVLDQGGKYTRVGLTFAEMDMSKLDGRNQSLIVSPFGVPLTLLTNRSELVASTYNNKAEDRKMFWQDRMWSETKEFEAEYQYYLQGDKGEFVMFDFSQVPALTMTPQEKAEQARLGLTAGALLVNDYLAIIGQDPKDDGDIYLRQSSIVEVPYRTKAELEAEKAEAEPEIIIGPAPEPTPNPPEPDDDQAGMPEANTEATNPNKAIDQINAVLRDRDKIKKSYDSEVRYINKIDNKEFRLTFWTKANEMAEDAEPDYRKAANKAFEQNKRALLAIVGKAKKKSIQSKATPDYEQMAEDVTDYLETESAGVWSKELTPAITGLMTERVLELNKLFGSTTSPQTLLAQQWFDDYIINFAQPINLTTNDNIVNLIALAEEGGWGIDTLSKRMGLLFDQWMTGDVTPEEFAWLEARLPVWRTEMIARTETMTSLNYASSELYNTNGWGEEWLATRDNRVRTYNNSDYDHLEADGQIKGPDGFFEVSGEQLRFPGDPAGSAGNVINCRCTVIPII